MYLPLKVANTLAFPVQRQSILKLVKSTMARRFCSSGNVALFKTLGASGLSRYWYILSAKVMIGKGNFATQ